MKTLAIVQDIRTIHFIHYHTQYTVQSKKSFILIYVVLIMLLTYIINGNDFSDNMGCKYQLTMMYT